MAIRLAQRAPVTSAFTVSTYPTDPFTGEVVSVVIDGDGGHSVGDDLKDIWIETDVDDAGASFRHRSSEDATKALGRVWGHAFGTTGTKTQTIRSRTFGGGEITQNFSVTVQDPDAYSWDRIYWIDFNGSTAGMPAEDATNIHILDYATFRTMSEGSPSEARRYRWRAGTTHVWGTTGLTLRRTYKSGLVMHDTFGGTEPAEWDVTRNDCPPTNQLVRINDATSPRIILNNLKITGPYDPVTGEINNASGYNGLVNLVKLESVSQPNSRVSLYRVESAGIKMLLNTQGSTGTNIVGVVDCKASDWQDFAVHLSGRPSVYAQRGCDFRQHPLAGNAEIDGKSGSDPDFADHGPVRIAAFDRVGITQSYASSTTGWSSLSGYDKAVQPIFRIYQNAAGQATDGYASIIGNTTKGGYFIQTGRPDNQDEITQVADYLIANNSHDFNHQRGLFAEANGNGGVRVLNNAIYKPPITMARGSVTYGLFKQQNQATVGGTDVPASVWQRSSYVGFNTYLSDMSDSQYMHAQQPDVTIFEVSIQGEIDSAVYTAENNQISADNHAEGGPYIATSAFARGDDFRPITAGAAVDTVTSGPVVDVNRNLRSNPTNKGAHHTHGTDVSVTAPVNSVAPTVAQVRSPLYQVTNLGTWTMGDDDEIMLERRWKLDGADAGGEPKAYSMCIDGTGLSSGSLLCEVTITNRSGTRTTVNSNTLSV